MPFALTPLTTFPKAAQVGFPKFIQLQSAGIALGDRGARVVNIVGNPAEVQATRGIGENKHVVTIRPLVKFVCLNGPLWTARTASATKAWNIAVLGGGVFVVGGIDNGTGVPAAMYSLNNGLTWTNSPTTFIYTFGLGFARGMMAYGNGIFLSLIDVKKMTSPDGINWTATTIAVPGGPSHIYFGNGKFVVVIVNSNQIMVGDGTTAFSNKTLPSSNTWAAGGYGNGRHIVIADQATAKSDDDGATWSAGGSLPSAVSCVTLAYGNGVWVGVPNAFTTTLYRSTDGGATWANTGTLNGTPEVFSRVRFIGGIFYVTAQGGANCYKSTDGNTWTLANPNVSMPSYTTEFDGGRIGGVFKYVAAGNPGSNVTTVNSGVCG
jgi:hypothetical protein